MRVSEVKEGWIDHTVEQGEWKYNLNLPPANKRRVPTVQLHIPFRRRKQKRKMSTIEKDGDGR